MKNATQKTSSRCRFTLVESIVFMLAAAILAITAASMLYFLYKSWAVNRVVIEMQQDATAAVVFLKDRLREADKDEVDVNADTHEILIDNDGGNRRFYVDEKNLIYDPDTGTPNDETILIRDRLTEFEPEHRGRRILFHIEMEDGDHKLEMDGIVEQRN